MKTIYVALYLLCAVAGVARAQADSGRIASHGSGPSIRAWGAFGMGAARFPGAKGDIFPPSLAEGWLAVGPVAFGLRRADLGDGTNTTDNIDVAPLLGARATYGHLALLAAGGRATVSSRIGNGGLTGRAVPMEEVQTWTAVGEVGWNFGRFVAWFLPLPHWRDARPELRALCRAAGWTVIANLPNA